MSHESHLHFLMQPRNQAYTSPPAVTVADRVLAAGTITGDRVNGLLDGQTGEWCAPTLHLCLLLLIKKESPNGYALRRP